MKDLRSKTILLCVGITACVIIGSVWSGLNFFTSLAGAALFWSVCYASSAFFGTVALVLGGVLSFAILGSITLPLVSLLSVGVTGAALYIAIRKKMGFKELMIVVMVVSALLNFGLMAFLIYLENGTVSMDLITAPYIDFLGQYYDYYAGETMQITKEQFLNQASQFVGYLLLGIIFAATQLKGFFSFVIGKALVKKQFHDPMHIYDYFKRFKLNRVGGILFFIAYTILFFSNGAEVRLIAMNFIIVMSPAFLLAGISALNAMFDKLKWSRRRKIIIYTLIGVTVLFPLFNLTLGLTAFGAADAIVNYRKIS